MALPQYSTGTVSVAAGGTVVTSLGGMWSGINVKQGDFISIANLAEVLITEVTDETHLKIAPWQGPAQTSAVYTIFQNYVGRVVGVAAAEDVGVMLEKLHVDGLPFILGVEETVPDPSYGDEGQLAFKPSTGQWWEKSGGAWVPSAGLTALGYGGTSSTSMLIGLSPPPKVFTTQNGLAYNGARVRAASAANLNNFMIGPATYSGTTLTITVDQIGGSGTYADWLFSVAGTGATGPQGPEGPIGPAGPPGSSGSGSGNVTGPASSGNDNIAAYNGVSGTVIKDSGVTVAALAASGNFIQAGTGAVTRTMQNKVREHISVKDFGAVGDGVADDTAKIQAAITAYQGTNATVFFPRGTYKVTSTLSITGGLRLEGESRAGAIISWTSTTLNVISINTNPQVAVERLTFVGPSSATAGSIIGLTGPTGTGNIFSYISDCSFYHGFSHVVTEAASDWTIDNCVFAEAVGTSVYVADILNNDAGDSYIGGGCTFVSNQPNCIHVLQASSGGLKIMGNKFLFGAYAYQLSLTATGANTVDLLIGGNSIESQYVAAIFLTRPSGSVQFGSIVIDGNQIAGAINTTNWYGIVTDANPNWLSRIVITDNSILTPTGSGGALFICINLGAPSSFLIDGNNFIAAPNPGGSTYGISIGGGATNGLLGLNRYDTFSSGAWLAKVSNGNPASVISTMPVPQSGSIAIACSTANGVLWVGIAHVTFPIAYDFTPKVTCTPGTVAAGVAAFPGSITKTGFDLICSAGINGGAGNATWDAFGVL
jgi:hypothetical protein